MFRTILRCGRCNLSDGPSYPDPARPNELLRCGICFQPLSLVRDGILVERACPADLTRRSIPCT